MGRPIVTSLSLAAAQANGYALSQGPVAGGTPLTLNGALVSNGVGVPDVARRVIITSAGNDSGINWTIVGLARNEMGNVKIQETISGANAGVAQSTQDYTEVISITPSGATASTVTAGTNGVASGPWVPWDQNQTEFMVSLYGRVLSGAPAWEVDYTYDDVFGLWLPPGLTVPNVLVHPRLVNQNGSQDDFFDKPIRASRLTVTNGGGAQLTQTQQGAGR